MAWVRIHDGAMTHPKVLKLSDRAFRLWVWGLTYAQQHLTDGWLPTLAIPGAFIKSIKDLLAVTLWANVDDGYAIHDYLDWNDSRDTVTKKRTEAKERMSNARSRRSLSVRANEPSNTSRTSPEVLRGLVSTSSGSSLERERERKPAMNGTLDPELAARAGLFCDRYSDLYSQHRRGARYLPRPALDYTKACELCQVWDNDRLERLAIVFLKCEEPFAQSGSRTIGQFAAMASWCDDRLREVEVNA